MSDGFTEHNLDGINVKVFNLPGGHYCALVVSADVVFQVTFNAELKPQSVVTDYVNQKERYAVVKDSPTPEMLLVMKMAALAHMSHLADE
jgi:hypothetical protein